MIRVRSVFDFLSNVSTLVFVIFTLLQGSGWRMFRISVSRWVFWFIRYQIMFILNVLNVPSFRFRWTKCIRQFGSNLFIFLYLTNIFTNYTGVIWVLLWIGFYRNPELRWRQRVSDRISSHLSSVFLFIIKTFFCRSVLYIQCTMCKV